MTTENQENHGVDEVRNDQDLAQLAQLAQGHKDTNFLLRKLGKTPYLKNEIFQQLPELLQTSSSHFESFRERDTYFLSALTALSGIFPSVSGTYAGDTVFANLYFMAIAPPASGKGVLKHSRELGLKIHKELLQNSQKERRKYLKSMAEYNKSKGSMEMPEEPKFELLFIPANSSTAAIIRYLDDNNGRGVLFDSEADTLSTVFKQEWGNYSDILRKGFHQEPIPTGRKNPEDYREVENPKFSVVLSGTLAQAKDMFPSAENGLVSRFLFYLFSSKPNWQDASPSDKPNLTEKFKEYADEVYEISQFINKQKIIFDLTATQWKLHKETFEVYLKKGYYLLNNEGASMVKRLGLVAYRIAMVLSIIRKYQNRDEDEKLICEDIDFNTSLSIINTLIKHSQFIFNIIPKAEFSGINEQQRKFFDMLPSNKIFKREEAGNIGKNLGIAERTISKYLKKLTEKGLLKKDIYAMYEKT